MLMVYVLFFFPGKVWLQDRFEDIQQPQCPPGFTKPPLILVSLDGFRAEYLKDHSSHIPVINALRKYGTSTPHMRPVYPTKTFPNHYSIVTGLYPESHGIVDNKMYDVKRNAFFSLKTNEKFNAEWYQGEPVWVTAMRQNLKTATFFWPGSDVNITGTFPTFYHMYDQKVNFEKRVTTMFEWLELPEGQRPDFLTLYMDEPDSSGHRHGPGSKQVVEALENVDRILGMFMDGLKERNLHNCVNLIVVSDHGMEEATCDKAVFVSSYVNDTEGFTVIQGPAARIRPSRLPEEYSTCEFLLIPNCPFPCRTHDQAMRPYLKEHLPKRFHFAHHERIERGHLYMKEGWQAAMRKTEMKYCSGGFHGSDNVFKNMQAIFIGYGPGFKHKTVVPPFENIEVYNLMCDLLGIRPAPNNGTHGSLNHLLKTTFYQPVHPAPLSHDTPCDASNPTPSDDRQCSCTNQTEDMVFENALHLLFSDSTKAQLRKQHHPFGAPHVVQPDIPFCLLHHRDFLSGYSQDRLLPLWVSYTIPRLVSELDPAVVHCVRADVRISPSQSQMCSRYGNDTELTFGLLTLLSTLTGSVWELFHSTLLPKYSQQLNGVNVISGPIFDEDFDGNVDKPKPIVDSRAPTPTHFFLILTSCGNSSLSPGSCSGPLRVQSFILPHRPDHSENCGVKHGAEEWMKLHTARVRDVELLSGLSFYHSRISVDETLQLKTYLQTS
uniref:Ectonucleotide pyrophosphatase/phosphodiesterase 1 n=1 Tax=Neogobius melanostomus TaxID=47308 RepID=A0A8C6SRT6_9GOBI